jgi:hypothetical protein
LQLDEIEGILNKEEFAVLDTLLSKCGFNSYEGCLDFTKDIVEDIAMTLIDLLNNQGEYSRVEMTTDLLTDVEPEANFCDVMVVLNTLAYTLRTVLYAHLRASDVVE